MKMFMATAFVAFASAFGPFAGAQAQKCEASAGSACLESAVFHQAVLQNADLRPIRSNVNFMVSKDMSLDHPAALLGHASIPAQDPTVAWLIALGFLGIIVLRRTRSGPMV
jgi:hypothetical protein